VKTKVEFQDVVEFLMKDLNLRSSILLEVEPLRNKPLIAFKP